MSFPALLDLAMVARSRGLGSIDGQDLDAQVYPRGLRILSKIPRLPVVTARAVVEQWGSLQGVLGATIEELEAVEGVGAQRARTLRDGLSRLAEISVVERYSRARRSPGLPVRHPGHRLQKAVSRRRRPGPQ